MKQHQGLTAEMYQTIVAIVDDRVEGARVTRRDYDRLVEAQGRVEDRMERVEAVIERLAEAQTRTEDRVGRVEDRVGRLEEGQASMQAAIERLAEAQMRTEDRVGRLEEGQASMQAAIERLAEAQARTDAAVGGLADVIGYGLEDVARLLLPPYLHRHWGIQLEGPAGEELHRRFFPMEGQPPIEIDLHGEGQRDGQQVIVLGEAKSRIGGSVVRDFADVLEQVEPLVEGEVWRVMFGYYIHPSAQPVAEEHHILLVASYQR